MTITMNERGELVIPQSDVDGLMAVMNSYPRDSVTYLALAGILPAGAALSGMPSSPHRIPAPCRTCQSVNWTPRLRVAKGHTEAHDPGFWVECEGCETRGPSAPDESAAVIAWDLLMGRT